MPKAYTLVELMLALAVSCVLLLILGSGCGLIRQSCQNSRSGWCALQSLRQAEVLLDNDFRQLGGLLPADLHVQTWADHLLLPGVAITSRHPGLSLGSQPPPYYALARSVNGRCLELDTLDIDVDGRVDFIAGQGLIGESCLGVIDKVDAAAKTVWLTETPRGEPDVGQRIVPAVCYERRGMELWRNGQLVVENLTGFETESSADALRISLASGSGGSQRRVELACPLP